MLSHSGNGGGAFETPSRCAPISTQSKDTDENIVHENRAYRTRFRCLPNGRYEVFPTRQVDDDRGLLEGKLFISCATFSCRPMKYSQRIGHGFLPLHKHRLCESTSPQQRNKHPPQFQCFASTPAASKLRYFIPPPTTLGGGCCSTSPRSKVQRCAITRGVSFQHNSHPSNQL